MGQFILSILEALLSFLKWVLILNAILSWLVYFDVVNLRHPLARQIAQFLDAVSRPVLRPFQKIIPPLGGVDLSIIVAVIVIQAAQIYLLPWLFAPIIGLLGG